MDQELKQTVLFEEKVYLTPKDMNTILKKNIDSIILTHLRDKLENRCSQHGFVIPGKLQILSRSMGILENGKFTGNIVYYVQVQGEVYNPANGTHIVAKILKRNKMGIYCIYKDAIRILVPRDLHLGNEEFDSLQIGEIKISNPRSIYFECWNFY
jgi:DNA-directed RNA polymerase subunit E'/Rpb7